MRLQILWSNNSENDSLNLARSYHMEITKYSKQLKSTASLSFRLTYLKAEMSTSICLFHFRFDILWSMSQSYLEYKLNEFNWHAKYKCKKSYRKKKKKKSDFTFALYPALTILTTPQTS